MQQRFKMKWRRRCRRWERRRLKSFSRSPSVKTHSAKCRMCVGKSSTVDPTVGTGLSARRDVRRTESSEPTAGPTALDCQFLSSKRSWMTFSKMNQPKQKLQLVSSAVFILVPPRRIKDKAEPFLSGYRLSYCAIKRLEGAPHWNTEFFNKTGDL